MTEKCTVSMMGLIGDKGLAIATWIAILGTLAVNTLSNIFPIDGNTVADLANGPLAGVLITPANYAFIIWGVIYVGLIAYAWYQPAGVDGIVEVSTATREELLDALRRIQLSDSVL